MEELNADWEVVKAFENDEHLQVKQNGYWYDINGCSKQELFHFLSGGEIFRIKPEQYETSDLFNFDEVLGLTVTTTGGDYKLTYEVFDGKIICETVKLEQI